MGVPHPIPYQGSKRNLAQTIIRFFPDDADRLVEPFAGSAAVTLAASYNEKANTFVLNDLNKPLIDVWNEIIYRPSDITDAYARLWKAQTGNERCFYDHIRDEFNKIKLPEYFLYLLARCVKASVRYNFKGEFNQSPDNRRKGTRPNKMRENIVGASRLLQGKVTLLSVDYRDCLSLAAPADVVYMDPPYQGVSKTRDPRYIQGVSYNEFVNALYSLNSDNISYILSYDGKSGIKSFGRSMPKSLGLTHIEVDAGRSTQATLLGRNTNTIESLYLSPALVERLGVLPHMLPDTQKMQADLFEMT